MPTREQLTHERLQALIDVLVAQGTLSEERAEVLKQTREFGEARQIAQNARNGDPPGQGRDDK